MADRKASLLITLKDRASGGMGKLRQGFSSLRGGILAVGAALTGFVAIGVSALKAYAKQEDAINKLNTALKNQGIVSQEVTKDLTDYASELQKVTTFGDEVIIEQQALLATFGLTGDKLKAATVAALDLSTALGIDLKASTLLLGKAAGGDISTLSRYGIKIKEGIPPAEKFNAVLETLNKQFGGQARAAINTTSGRMKQLTNRVGDLNEKIGQELIPVFQAWVSIFEKVVKLIEGFTEADKAALKGRELTIQALKDERFQLLKTREEILKNPAFLTKDTDARIKSTNAKIESINKALDRERSALTEEKAIAVERQQITLPGGAGPKGDDKATKAKEALEKKLAGETETILEGLATRKEQEQELLAEFQINEADRLAEGLGIEEALKLKSHQQQLKAIGKFDKAKLIKEKALVKADDKIKLKQAQIGKERLQNRIANTAVALNAIASLSTSSNSKLAAIGKASAIALATIDTFAAANVALRSAPPPFNFALAALVTTAGLVNVAKIAGVGLQEGGVVLPRPGGTQATLGEGGQAEAVIPLDDAGDFLGEGQTVININAGVLVADDSSVEDFAMRIDEEMSKLRQRNRSLAFRG